MPNYNHDVYVTHTKAECASPATTKSESYSNRNGMTVKEEEHDEIVSPISSSRKGESRKVKKPSRRDQQLMRQVSGLDLNDYDIVSDEELRTMNMSKISYTYRDNLA